MAERQVAFAILDFVRIFALLQSFNHMKSSAFLSIFAAMLCVCAVNSCDLLGGPGSEENKKPSDEPDIIEVDWSDPAWYSTNFWERTDRERAGLRGPVKKWHISNYTTYDEYEYDAAGHLIREAYVNTDNPQNNHEWRYTYDSAGHRTRKEYFGSEDSPADYTIYEYDNPGKFVALEWFMMGPSVVGAEDGICKDLSKTIRVVEQPLSKNYSETSYTFGEDGNLTIRQSSYSINEGSTEKEGETTLEYTFVYEGGYPKSLSSDQLRFEVVDITYYPNGMYKDFEYLEENAYNFETGKDRHTYKMLDNPRYLTVESFDLGGKASYMSLTPKWIRRTYDEHFDIVRNDESYGDDDFTEGAEPTYTDTWAEYTYDKYGNWTTRLETVVPRYTGGTSETRVNRVIEYFE